LSWCWALILRVVVGGLHYAFGWICHCSCYEIVVLFSTIFWEVILFFFKNEVVFCVFLVWVHGSLCFLLFIYVGSSHFLWIISICWLLC
jgi:hypothetical protein